MTLLIEISALSPCCTDDALEYLHKAISDGGDGDAIWDAHPSPFVRRLIELFTERGLLRLESFRKELEVWVRGAYWQAGERPARPPGAMERWGVNELKLVRLYLERLPPALWTLNDHMMMVDYLVQRYLPADELKSEAEWLAVRSTLMGRVQENMDALKASQAETVAAKLPLTIADAPEQFRLSSPQLEMLAYAGEHAAENVRQFSEQARHRLRSLILDHVHDRALGVLQGSSLETQLLDLFATFNRDWRRIAVTESGEALNQGYIASLSPGAQVKRVEQYRGACPFCRRIDGRIATVVSPGGARVSKLNSAFARVAGLDPGSAAFHDDAPIQGANLKPMIPRSGLIGRFDFGGVRLKDVYAQVADLPVMQQVDGTRPVLWLGSDLLQTLRFVYDHDGRRVWFRHSSCIRKE